MKMYKKPLKLNTRKMNNGKKIGRDNKEDQ